MVSDARLARIRARSEQQGVRAVLLAAGDDVIYALGGYTPMADERICFLVVGPQGAAMVVPGVNAHEAHELLDGGPVSVYDFQDADGGGDALEEALRTAAGPATGGRLLVSDAARHDHVRVIRQVLAPDGIGLASQVMRPLRMVKDADEVERLQVASDAADETFGCGVAAIRRGLSERELQDVMLDSFRRLGSDGLSFQGVAFGAHTAAPHHHADETPVTEGALWFDIGCRKNGYCSDLTRPVYVGTPDPEFLTVHQIVLEARMAGEAAARSGNPASAVDRAARAVIDRAGYGEYFVHRTGHGIGVSVHEPPFMMEGDETVLEPGMSFSIEPGIYLPGRFGVRIEDIAVVTDGPARILSRLSREPVIID
jgi:Xaa-Pro aminopeptidase